MATTPEGRVKNRLKAMLKKLNVWYYMPQAGPFGRAGIPDLILIVEGRFVGVECKADRRKKPTPLQVTAMQQIEDAGGKCFVVCDYDTQDELERWITDASDTEGSRFST
ncbi:MAG: putative nuclease [Prokaryotic dsDNA virus sp.]|jgi:hypothetical protein|nr:MAG: putative nuclease [Prokaryotic dsDNA virus sp.]|tara:strand:- start:35551 stop:35877 length:327 start_codon:yes stop_codon:yes gene_type:complete